MFLCHQCFLSFSHILILPWWLFICMVLAFWIGCIFAQLFSVIVQQFLLFNNPPHINKQQFYWATCRTHKVIRSMLLWWQYLYIYLEIVEEHIIHTITIKCHLSFPSFIIRIISRFSVLLRLFRRNGMVLTTKAKSRHSDENCNDKESYIALRTQSAQIIREVFMCCVLIILGTSMYIECMPSLTMPHLHTLYTLH